MKKILSYLKNHVREDFHPGYYLSVALYLAFAIALNYRYEIEDVWIDQHQGSFWCTFLYFCLYSAAFYPVSLMFAYFKKRWDIFSKPAFWAKSLTAMGILAFSGSIFFHGMFAEAFFDPQMQYFATKCAVNVFTSLSVLLPLAVFYHTYDKTEKSRFYGLTTVGFDWKPYGLMLLIMVPGIAAASFNADFIEQYPTYKENLAASYLGLPEWPLAGFYELVYGADFLSVELIFRGFMIIGFVSFFGRGAVLPMVAVYVFLHFGKPMGETISSAFGGYLLGVIAYETRSVFGGVWVHVGIAWMMELAAFGQLMAK